MEREELEEQIIKNVASSIEKYVLENSDKETFSKPYIDEYVTDEMLAKLNITDAYNHYYTLDDGIDYTSDYLRFLYDIFLELYRNKNINLDLIEADTFKEAFDNDW